MSGMLVTSRALALASLFLLHSMARLTESTTEHRSEVLDHDGNYSVDWYIDYAASRVDFKVTVRTTGFVGFGISPNGGMVGADIVIGGVHPNGSHYFSDRHGVGASEPVVDLQQDWILSDATQNETHTELSFWRPFDTCDEEDLALTDDTTSFIWAYGQDDTIGYHGVGVRGAVTVQPLDPETPPLNVSAISKYEITHTMVMPEADTTYWCTIHRSPRFTDKHHIVAFEPKIESDEARAHTHHYNIYRCTAPEGEDLGYFDQFVGQAGGECFVPQPVVPSAHCQTMFYNWAVGGRMLTLPLDIGYPIGETGSPVDYYMFEIHYNNPEGLRGLEFETGATVYYTDELREHDAGLMVVAHHTSISLTIPPSSSGYQTVGHCDPYCTTNYLPATGINVFAIMLHAHVAGRKMKFRQFRGDSELPWLAVDDMYDFDFQQTRPLKNELKIMPGDHLTVECTYDNMDAKGQVTIGGLSTKEEMCQSIFWYWPRAELRDCRSETPIEVLFRKFGIENATRGTPYEDAIITAPEKYSGKRYTEVLNEFVEWTPSFRSDLQAEALHGSHVGVCMTERSGDYLVAATTYPRLQSEYQPVRVCQSLAVTIFRPLSVLPSIFSVFLIEFVRMHFM